MTRKGKSNRIVHFRVGCPAFTFLFALLTFGCAAQKSGKPYTEDLSVYRPKFQITDDSIHRTIPIDSVKPLYTPTHFVNEKVDAILDSIDRFNLTKRYVDGFTLQVYAGQKKEDAMNAKQKMSNDAPDLVANMQYVQPKFRVTVGNYFTKLEAQKDLQRLKRIFPNAILVPEKVQLK